MAILPLVIAPDPRLAQKSEPITEVTEDIRTLAENMLETMYANNGIGLAAVQVGHMVRMVTVDVEWESPRYLEEHGEDAPAKAGNPYVLINPEIADENATLSTFKEGCLSFPDQYSEVKRPESVTVRYLDVDGKAQTLQAEGLLATCIQHEIDHINGVVFVDHISRLKRDMIMKRLKKLKKWMESQPQQSAEKASVS